MTPAATRVEPGAGARGAPPRELAVRFGRDGALAGVLTAPPSTGAGRPAVVFISAGMVHRVGPNRMYVNLARGLASLGVPSVRFDLSGIGDSPHRADGMPADESAVLETRQVMASLEATWGIRTFVLAGLCSGAVTAFRTALHDPRVTGVVLLNPQGFHPDAAWNAHVLSRTQARRYVTQAARTADNWRRALRGQIDYRRAVRVLFRRITDSRGPTGGVGTIASELSAGFRALDARGVRVLAICSEGDSSIDYLTTILGQDMGRDRDAGTFTLRVFARTDHSVTLASAQQMLASTVQAWVTDLIPLEKGGAA